MPRYDFLCPVCLVTFEAITPVDVVTLPCVSCQQIQAVRQLSYPAQIHIH